MIWEFLKEAHRFTLHMEHHKRMREGGATIKVTKIMPITLMNDAQYRLPGHILNAELETEYVNPCRHCQPRINGEILPKKKKRDRPHTKIRHTV